MTLYERIHGKAVAIEPQPRKTPRWIELRQERVAKNPTSRWLAEKEVEAA
jgi:hypothetical protein